MTGKMKLYGMDQVVERLAADTKSAESRFGLEWMQPATAIGISVIAGALMGMLDWILAGELGRPDWSFVASLLTAAGSAAVVGILLLPLLFLLPKILGNIERPKTALTIGILIISAVPLAFLVPPLLAMPGVSEESRLQLRIAVVGVLILLALMITVFAVRQMLLPSRSRSRIGPLLGAFVFLCLGIATQLADARLLTGGYPEAHLIAVGVSFSSYCLFILGLFATLEDQVPRHFGRLLAFALLIIGLTISFHIWIRGQASVHILREGLFRPPFTVTRKVLPEMEKYFLNAWAPIGKVKTVNADRLVETALNPINRRAQLDAILGIGRQDWNVVLITADTLRADEAGWQRAKQDHPSLTPNLDLWAQKSIVLSQAYTPYPTSSYAYSSMLTGYYPRFTPARRPFEPKGKYFEGKLLTQVLKDRGHATWAITAFNEAGIRDDATFGHTRPGFDVVNPLGNVKKLDARLVTECALEHINKRDKDKPFFLWAHYMDAHAVYRKHDDPRFSFGESPKDLYRGEIAYVDHHLAALLKRLESDDLAAKTLVIFVSDHGESFDEHETSFHNSNLHVEQIHVPAFVHVPGTQPNTRDHVFNLVDTTPTVLALLGIQDPEPRQGRDFSGPLLGLVDDGEWTDFSLSERFARDPLPGREAERALIFDGGKIIRYVDDVSARHFSLANDPKELHNNFDPSDAKQQLRLGFMESLNRHFDRGFGRGGNRFSQLLEIFDEALTQLENEDPSDDLGAVIAFAKNMFDREHRYVERLDGLLGKERLARMIKALTPLPYAAHHADTVRYAALELLLSLPHEGITPFMLDGLKSTNAKMRGECALWLLKRDNEMGLKILIDSLGDPIGEWNLRIAPRLVKHRPAGLAPWLLPNLSNDRSDPAIAAIQALSDIEYSNLDFTLRAHLSAPAFGLTLPRTQISLAQAAAKLTGLDSNSLLARLALSTVPEARRTAREALSLRLSQDAFEIQIEAATQEMLADESVLERRNPEAIDRLRRALALSAKNTHDDGFLRLKLARTLALENQKSEARTLIAPLLGTTSEFRPWLKSAARGLARFIEQDDRSSTNANQLELAATIDPKSTILPVRQMTFFAREIQLTNKGKRQILGGIWPWGHRLTWLFRNAKTGEWLSSKSARLLTSSFLPPAGIAPGQTIRITAVGRTPNPNGLWIPVLVLKSEPWFSLNHKVLLELPPVKI